jgi:hypothetical protein
VRPPAPTSRLVLLSFSRFPAAMPAQPPGDRAVLLACSVGTLRGFWIEATRCRTTFLPLRLMASNPGLADRTLADVLVPLRCQKCHQASANAALVRDPASQASGRSGSPAGRRVMLTGDGAL